MLALRQWSTRRWVVAAMSAALSIFLVAVSTAMVPSPVFGRDVPPTAWSWPVLVLTGLLSGLLVATYVRSPGSLDSGPARSDATTKSGTIGGLLTYFAVGCPVCNKLALLALGYSGALQWFAPMQPYLAAAGIGLLAWALRARLIGELRCPVGSTAEQSVAVGG